MTTAELVVRFLNHKDAKCGCLTSDNGTLYSYRCPIAEWDGTTLKLNTRHFSRTSKGHTNLLKRICAEKGIKFVEFLKPQKFGDYWTWHDEEEEY